ncbi:MAG: winged helix-turn-helix domain-containing protein [Pseudomonadota bacterium]
MRYIFGPFELDTSTLELRRQGELISVEPQVFELLAHLIEHRDRVLSKDDLIEAIWGGRIVSDAAISSRIKLVRRAVDDDGTRQAVIKTVHGKGFRFIADLEPASTATPEPMPAPIPAQDVAPAAEVEPAPKKERKLLVPVAMVASAVLGLFLLIQLFPSQAEISENRIAVLPVTNATGDSSLDWAELGLMSLVMHDLEARSELPLVKAQTMMTLSERFPDAVTEELLPKEALQTALQDGYGASHLIVSHLKGTADNLTLEYRVINPRGQSAPASVSGQLAAKLAEEMARQVAATLPRSGERNQDVSVSMFDDVYVTESFARGRDLQLKGMGVEAADLFRAALTQAPDNLKIQYELAVSVRMSGDMDLATTMFNDVIEKARAADDAEVLGAALNGLGALQLTLRDDETALATFKQALEVLEDTAKPETRALILTNIGRSEQRLGNYTAAEDALALARVEFQAAGYDAAPGHLLTALASLKVRTRDVAKANEYLTEALDYFRLVGDRRAEGNALQDIGHNAVQLYEFEKAETILNQALVMRKEMGDFPGQMTTLFSLAQMEINSGHAAQAEAHAAEMIRLAEEAGDTYRYARAQIIASHIDFVLADWPAAIAHSADAEAVFEELSRTRNVYRERIRQAVYHGYAGATDGKAEVESVLRWGQDENQRGTQLNALEALNVLDLIDGDLEAAADRIDAAVTLSAEMRLEAVHGRISARQGLVRMLQGDESGAKASLGRAKAENPEQHETLLLEGLVARADGDLDRAAELMAKAKSRAGDNWLLTERLFHAALEGA